MDVNDRLIATAEQHGELGRAGVARHNRAIGLFMLGDAQAAYNEARRLAEAVVADHMLGEEIGRQVAAPLAELLNQAGAAISEAVPADLLSGLATLDENATNELLDLAYEHLEAGRTDEAIALLKPAADGGTPAQTTTVTVTEQGVQAAFKLGVPVGGIEIDTPRRGTEVSRIQTSIEPFGINTAEAGWRMSITNAREIPLDTTGLRSVIVTPSAVGAQVSVNAVAEIEVSTFGDRWLTWAFKRRDAATSITYSIPA